MPPEYGNWNSVAKRFRRWVEQGIWEKILECIVDDPDYEWLMIDASHVKVHPHAAGAVGGNQDMERTKGGSIQRYILPWMRMVCRSRVLVTAGTVADCTQGCALIDGIFAEWLMGDKGYDSNAIIAKAHEERMFETYLVNQNVIGSTVITALDYSELMMYSTYEGKVFMKSRDHFRTIDEKWFIPADSVTANANVIRLKDGRMMILIKLVSPIIRIAELGGADFVALFSTDDGHTFGNPVRLNSVH